MKYVRTKDGIYEAKKNKVGAWITKLPYKIFDRDIIKQANTIEELCDEIVLVGISGIPYGVKQLLDEEDKHNKDFLISLIKSQDYELYGAIWTDKGLIYVAKMNDKGELELL